MVHSYNPSYSGGWGRRIAEPMMWRLQWAGIAPLHSSLGNKSETLSRKKKYPVWRTSTSGFDEVSSNSPLAINSCKTGQNIWSNCFQTLEFRQCWTLIPGKREIHEMNPLVTLSFFSGGTGKWSPSWWQLLYCSEEAEITVQGCWGGWNL